MEGNIINQRTEQQCRRIKKDEKKIQLTSSVCNPKDLKMDVTLTTEK
jgi:hypothetical protein